MRNLIDIMVKNSIICPKMDKVDKQKFKIRKKINIYNGVTIQSHRILIFHIERKSKISQREIRLLNDIGLKLIERSKIIFKTKILVINAPTCSKAKRLSEGLGWKFLD